MLLLSPEQTWKNNLGVTICSFPEYGIWGKTHRFRWQTGKRCKANVFCAQQISRLWISMPRDVMDLKGLKGLKVIECINERKIHRGSGTPRCHLCSCSQKSLVTILRDFFYITAYFYVLPKVGNICCWQRQDPELAGPWIWSSVSVLVILHQFSAREKRWGILVLRTFKLWIPYVQFPGLSKKNRNLTDIKSIQRFFRDLGYNA